MINHIWTVLASNSIVDASTNLISLQNVLEKIDVNIAGSVPKGTNIVVPIEFEIVSLWSDDNTNDKRVYNVKIELINSEKKSHGAFEQLITLEKNIRRFRSILKVSGLPVTQSGIYYFKIQIKSEKETKYKEISKIPLEVNISLTPHQHPAQS